MWSGANFGHRAKIAFFEWSQAVEADAEEAGIEGCGCGGGGILAVFEGDRGGGGDIPGVLAPFLEEVGVSLGGGDEVVEGCWFEGDVFLSGGNGEGIACLLGVKRSDKGKVEESLGIGFGFPHLTSELG